MRTAGAKPSASGAARPTAATMSRLVKASSMAPRSLRGPFGVTRNSRRPAETEGAMSILSEPTPSPTGSRASDFRPIADYGLLADCSSAALVDRDGSIDWLCMPHYDSPALFARILDPNAGHWSLAPVEASTTKRRYVPGP